ncbi:MAG: hypothetical protein RR224_01790 [Clostridia bacterium]
MTPQEILAKLETGIRLQGMNTYTVKECIKKAIVFMRHFGISADEIGESEFRAFLEYLSRKTACSGKYQHLQQCTSAFA